MRGYSLRALLLGAAAASIGSGAAQAQAQGPITTVSAVTVTAIKTEARTDEVPSAVSVITEDDIEEMLATDINDLVRYEPGVSVRNNQGRFGAALGTTGRDGNSGFNIRGLEGNRVLIQVDGVRVPDAFEFGAQSAGRGDYVDLGILERVEILRGPGSALYGSDGVAGVVSFITKDPAGFLGSNENFAARGTASYHSVDDSYAAGFAAAGRQGGLSGLLSYTRRVGHETDNQGTNAADDATAADNRTVPNPLDFESDTVLARAVLDLAPGHSLRLTGEFQTSTSDFDVLSARSGPTMFSSGTDDLDAFDEMDRSRVTLDYRYSGAGWIDTAKASIYVQNSASRQFSEEDRTTAPDRTRINTFDNDVWGFSAEALSSVGDVSGVTNDVIYGFDHSQTRQEGLRDGTVPPFGETFPARAFPNTDYSLTGIYIQDDIGLMDGRLRIIPALRYDSYELTPEPDAFYPTPVVAGQSDDNVSGKLGVVAWPVDNIGFFASYAQGFKAPMPSQVNNFFSNPAFGYDSIPNPDLRPETSNSFEGGVRWRGLQLLNAVWSGQITVYEGKYDDFIERDVVSGSFTPADPAIYQWVNLSGVELGGVEVTSDARWNNGVSARLAYSNGDGEYLLGGTTAPLNSVDPWKLVVGAGYDDPAGRFGGMVHVTQTGDKDPAREPQCAAPTGNDYCDGFTLVDLTAYWNLTDAAVLRAGVFNLFDEKHWWWSDARNVSPTSPIVDAFTAPGRNFSVSIGYRFP